MYKQKLYRYNKIMPKGHARLVALGVMVIMLLSGITFLELSNRINLFGDPSGRNDSSLSTGKNDEPDNNTINYSPGTESEKAETEAKKADGSIDNPSQVVNQAQPIDVVLSAAGQDYNGGPLIIKAVLSNLTGGTCDLTLSNAQNSKFYSTNVEWTGTYYTCKGFEIPATDLSEGDWQVKLLVTDGDQTAETSKIINVSLK